MIREEQIKKGLLLPLMEEFYTLQGEGYHSGKAAYFVRIGGCDVGCHWCDVKESWDASLHPLAATDEIVKNVVKYSDTVVVTGGEPSMYELGYFSIIFLALGGIMVVLFSGRSSLFYLSILFLANFVPALIFWSGARVRMPAEPALIILAAFFIEKIRVRLLK